MNDQTWDNLSRAVLNPTWAFVVKYLEDQRQLYVASLINAKDHDTSMELRGKIKELDTLLRLRDQIKASRNA